MGSTPRDTPVGSARRRAAGCARAASHQAPANLDREQVPVVGVGGMSLFGHAGQRGDSLELAVEGHGELVDQRIPHVVAQGGAGRQPQCRSGVVHDRRATDGDIRLMRTSQTWLPACEGARLGRGSTTTSPDRSRMHLRVRVRWDRHRRWKHFGCPMSPPECGTNRRDVITAAPVEERSGRVQPRPGRRLGPPVRPSCSTCAATEATRLAGSFW